MPPGCYTVTSDFPLREKYGLVTQMRRSAVSISSNIAEGCGRGTKPDFVRFLRIAYGSACELETQARVATEVEIGDRHQLELLISETDRLRGMLSAVIHRVKAEFPTVDREP